MTSCQSEQAMTQAVPKLVSGYSLVELMIGLLLASVLSLLAFTSYQQTSEHSLWLSRRQAALIEGVILSQWLRNAVHRHGDMGCLRASERGKAYALTDVVIQSTSATLPKAVKKNILPGSVALKFYAMTPIASVTTLTAHHLVSKPALSTKVGRTIYIADCRQLMATQVAALSTKHRRINFSQPVMRHFLAGSEVGQWQTEIIYLAKAIRGRRQMYRYAFGRSEALSERVVNWSVDTHLFAKGLLGIQLILKIDEQHTLPLSFVVAMSNR